MKLIRALLIGTLLGVTFPVYAQTRAVEMNVTEAAFVDVFVEYKSERCSDKFPILVRVKNRNSFPITDLKIMFAARYHNKSNAECAAVADFKDNIIEQGAYDAYCYDTLESNPPIIKGNLHEENKYPSEVSDVLLRKSHVDEYYEEYKVFNGMMRYSRSDDKKWHVKAYIEKYANNTKVARDYYRAKQFMGCLEIPDGVSWEGRVQSYSKFIR